MSNTDPDEVRRRQVREAAQLGAALRSISARQSTRRTPLQLRVEADQAEKRAQDLRALADRLDRDET